MLPLREGLPQVAYAVGGKTLVLLEALLSKRLGEWQEAEDAEGLIHANDFSPDRNDRLAKRQDTSEAMDGTPAEGLAVHQGEGLGYTLGCNEMARAGRLELRPGAR
eukprot:scaffold904_cov239-Pinguiococcus_pyrenoidosus.AAC.7